MIENKGSSPSQATQKQNTYMEIDYVLSYIDYEQEEIQCLYKSIIGEEYAKQTNNTYIRVDLLVRAILKNMPFINKVFIVCKDVQKLPNELELLISNSNGRIIRINESQIMPNGFITFSSACIEMFIWKIPNLSEYFIYCNDDMIPIRELDKTHFYYNDKPRIDAIYEHKELNNLYQLHCLNSTNLVFDRHKNDDDYNCYYNVAHTMRPLRKSLCKECYEKYEQQILNSLSIIRYYNNFNMDLYVLYGIKNKLIANEQLPYEFKYIGMPDTDAKLLNVIENLILNELDAPHVICVNDGCADKDEINEIADEISDIFSIILQDER